MDRIAAIIHDCGLLTYPLSYWQAMTASDWEELLAARPDDVHILKVYRDYVGNLSAQYAYLQARAMVKEDALDKISWILGPHIIYGDTLDYFGIIPKDIVGEIVRFLRIDYTGALPCTQITSFLGIVHSWDDRPAITDRTGVGIYYEWYQLGELHREGDRPAIVSLDHESQNFSWYLRGHECRAGNAPSYIQLHCQGSSYAVQSPPITTSNPRVIAEVDALTREYIAYV